MTLFEDLNLTTSCKNIPEKAVEIYTKKDTCIYETLCLYCANNDVNLKETTDEEFSSIVEVIELYRNGALEYEYDKFYFWID
jgi:hypothetical protein